MASTVYSRILIYEGNNPRFVFNRKGMRTIGIIVKEEWKRQGGNIDQLDSVQQIERDGTFMVLEYPRSFIEDIDQIIKKYVARVIIKGQKKRLNEKPVAPPKQQKQSESVPISSPLLHRKRKRISVAKPAFSGRNFNK